MAPQSEVRIGERLRFYRQAKGKTQAVVAGLAGVTEDYLSQIERGAEDSDAAAGSPVLEDPMRAGLRTARRVGDRS
jgi:DNA-binding XRE family transcriptional regulator